MSNCIGSNIFDILICLGLPWLLDTATVDQGRSVLIHDDMTYITVSLLAIGILVISLTYINGWKIDRKLGVIFVITYFCFTTWTCVTDIRNSLPIC